MHGCLQRKKRLPQTRSATGRAPIKQSSMSSVASSSAVQAAEAVHAPTGTLVKTPSGLSDASAEAAQTHADEARAPRQPKAAQYGKSASAHYIQERKSHGDGMRKYMSSRESNGKEEFAHAGGYCAHSVTLWFAQHAA